MRDIEKKFKQMLHRFVVSTKLRKCIVELMIGGGGNLKSIDFSIIIFTQVCSRYIKKIQNFYLYIFPIPLTVLEIFHEKNFCILSR